MNLVVGATGWLGSEICSRLRKRGLPVRALVRKSSDSAKVEQLRSLGAEIIAGDLQDRSSLERACSGATAIITTASTTISRQPHDSLEKTDLQGQLNLIEAAKKARVKRFVFISFSGNLEGDTLLHRAKRSAEKRLRESGLTYTILRPSCFMEMWLSPMFGFDIYNRKAQIYGSGNQPLSYISVHDVAEFAVEALVNDKAANQTIELGGPEPVTPREAVKIAEEEMGAEFEIIQLPEDALKQQFAAAQDEYQRTFASFMLGVCSGDPIDMKETLRKFPIRMTSVRDYLRRASAESPLNPARRPANQ